MAQRDNTQSSKEEATQVLLEEQFLYTEAYCNATTALHNALQQVAGGAAEELVDLYQATKEYQDALDRVQNNLQALKELAVVEEASGTRSRNANRCLTQHLERTRRVLTTIYQSGHGAAFYANGIPIPSSQSFTGSNNNNNARLVALATLRASIQSVTAEN